MLVRVDNTIPADIDAVVAGIFSDDDALAGIADTATVELAKRIKALGGAARFLETETTLFPEGSPAKRLVVIGAGKKADYKIAAARNLAGTAARQLRKKNAKKIALILPNGDLAAEKAAQAFAEGILLSVFDTEIYRTGEGREDKKLDEVVIISAQPEKISAAVERGVIIGEGINFSRSLGHEPSNNLYPAKLAEVAAEVAQKNELEFDALDKARLTEGGFKAILAVGQGSANEPRMIVVKYTGAGEGKPYFGLVGKGITFDSGGISLKPAEGMDAMKTDMCGGAWVLGLMQIIARLKPAINVIGVVAAAENMPSGTAYRPGDVIGTLEGKTIEVLNTDAEGRIVLADALTYARRLGATKLVDLATLTGACVIALGSAAPGVFGSNDDWTGKFLQAAKDAGEQAWHMPLFPEYSEQIKSSVGDIVNTGGRAAGACTAAAFLKEFTGDVPWIHLDIAGVNNFESEKPYISKGASGYIMRSLLEFVLADVEA